MLFVIIGKGILVELSNDKSLQIQFFGVFAEPLHLTLGIRDLGRLDPLFVGSQFGEGVTKVNERCSSVFQNLSLE